MEPVEFVRKTRKDGFAIVKTRCNQCMYKNSIAWAKMIA